MISQQYIKDLELKSIEGIYNYIVESEVNGAITQYKELVNKLSNTQFKDFIFYLRMMDVDESKFINARMERGL